MAKFGTNVIRCNSQVHFKLHESYENQNRIVMAPPYEVTETGWGEFEIVIKVISLFQTENDRLDEKLVEGKPHYAWYSPGSKAASSRHHVNTAGMAPRETLN